MTTTKPAKRPRGEGQWALGYREPLNPNEQFKKDDDALNVRARILDIYSSRASTASTSRTCAAACGGGASIRRDVPVFRGVGPARWNPTSSKTSSS